MTTTEAHYGLDLPAVRTHVLTAGPGSAVAMIHGIVRLTRNEVVDRFKGHLQLARLIHRQPRTQHSKQHQDNRHHQKFDHNPVMPRMGWICGRMADGGEK